MDAFGYEEPSWAVDDDLFGDDGEGGDGDENNGNSSDANYGAEHLLLLFDCNHTMFEKYVPCLSEDGEESNLVSPMDVAVTAASQFLRSKIRDISETKGGKRDGVGVLLYGSDPNRAIRNKRSSTPKSNASSGDVSDEVEELPPTYELIELAPPGIDSVLTMKKCLPPDQPNQKQRDLGKEFSAPPKKEGKMGEDDDDDEDDNDCTLFRCLLAASKIFDNAKCVRNPTTSSKELPDSKAVWIFTNQSASRIKL